MSVVSCQKDPSAPALRAVLGHYPLQELRFAEGLGNRGGFSGARLWQVDAAAGPLCLRAWPPGDPAPPRLAWLHGLMREARQAGLTFVPGVVVAADGSTAVAHGGRLWDLTAWMPGTADFWRAPSDARLRAASLALARLHNAWARLAPGYGVCPGLRRRLARCEDWSRLVGGGWRPVSMPSDPVAPWAERAWRLLPAWTGRVAELLAPWAARPLPLHPCLCDVWHDHLLFKGDGLTGLIDYGSAREDHAGADLARLLGSLVGDDPHGWAVGLESYAAVRPLRAGEEGLARVLDRTGVILGAANWLRWLYHDGRAFEDREAVAARLAALVRRMEGWTFPGCG